ncbi:MAG: efflux RND transporter periplasmic adaptor subunit [Bryobacteraceae bacterium]
MSAARSAHERTKILNADNKNVSDQVLQDATARLQAEEARFQAATQTVQQIKASLQSTDPTGSRRLIVERGGEVVELIAQPGEVIDSGSPILRVAKLNQLLARIDIPVGQHVPPSVTTARIAPVGFEHEPLPARKIAVAITAGTPASGQTQQGQGEAFLFRLTNNLFGLRPGVAVTAYLDLPGPSQPGVLIPQSAVVRFEGSGFTYIQRATDVFVRKQVSLDHPTNSGYFTTENFQPGDRVVVAGAQTLLSEEFKSQLSDTD